MKINFGNCVALLLLAFFLTSCSRKPSGANQARNVGAVPVQVAKAEARDVPVEIRGVGNVQAYSTVSVRPQITGLILQVRFEDGREVKAGDLLFMIDPRPFEAMLNQARANLTRDEAALVNARLQFERTSNLFNAKIASQQDYDAAQAGFASAVATVLADGAAVTNVSVSLGYTQIRAPIEGRTGGAMVKAGNVVKAPDDVLVTITQVHPIYAAFSVPEQNLPAIRQRMAEASLPVLAKISGSSKSPRGTLTFINNTVDTNTGTILLRATFPNEDNVLWPGQFIEASLTLSNLVHATVVPSQAVQSGQNGEYLFVVKQDETVEVRTNLMTGVTTEGMTVIESGLNPGETVVTDGQLRLTPGAKVSVKTPETASAK
jgi:multidrug efflux system membrane fusion protein